MIRNKSKKPRKLSTRKGRSQKKGSSSPSAQARRGGAVRGRTSSPPRTTSAVRVSASATLFRSLVEDGLDGIAMVNSLGTIVYAAPTTSRILGYAPKEFVGLNIFELVHADDRDRLNDLFEELLKHSEQTMITEFRIKHKNGAWRWIEGTGKNLIADPDVQAIVVNYHDVSARKQSEQESLRMAAIIESSNDAVVSRSLDGTILTWNRAAERLFGYTAREAKGRKVSMLIPREHGNEIQDVAKKLQRGERIEDFETVRIRKDGKTIEVSVTISPIRDVTGKIVGASAISRDITERKRVQAEMRASEARYRTLVERMSEGLLQADNNIIQFVNTRFCEMFGYTPDELIGKRAMDILVAPEDRILIKERNRRRAQGISDQYEIRMRKKSGDFVWMQIGAAPVVDGSARVVGSIGIYTDITERKRAEKQLQLLAHAVESTTELISITDQEDRFTFVNSAFLKAYGYEEREILGQLPAIIVSPNNPPDISANILSETRRGGWKGELLNVRKDGAEFPISLHTSQIRDADGMAIGYMGIATDITERKRTEEQLRSSEERYRNLVENISEIYFVTDRKGLITYGSPNFFARTGYEPEEILGHSYVRLIAAQDQKRVVQFYLDRTQDGTIDVVCEFRGRHRDGHLTWVEQATRIIRNQNGKVLEYRNVVRDATRRKEVEEQIRRLNAELEERIQQRTTEVVSQKNKLATANEELANLVYELKQAKVKAEGASKAKSQFLTKISHELRTPLTSVIGFANTLLKNKGGNLTQENILFLQRIVDNGRHLFYLINDMLDLSKIEAGRMELRLSPVSLQYLIEETVGELEIQLRPEDVQFRIEIPPILERLETDVQKLKQVLINLVGNALKFTERGVVSVAVEADAELHKPTRIHISDTGIGIPQERLDTIFEAFSQVDNTLARHYGGTGLGLTISRSLCQLMGYELVVKSEVNKGSTFSIILSPNSSKT